MFRNNLKIAWRHLLKDKYISAINFTGLVVGMTAVLFIWQYVSYETNYDGFHENGADIYRVRTDRLDDGVPFMQFAAGAACAGPVISQNFAEVENYVKLKQSGDAVYSTRRDVLYEPEKVYYCMPSLFEMFSFNLIKGDPKTCLNEPFTTVISETTARKMFGEEDPMGKTITRNRNDDYKVTGIIEDSPQNSHLKFDILLSYITYSDVFIDDGSSETAPYWDGFLTYLQLKPNTDWKALEAKIPAAMEKTYDEKTMSEVYFYLQPYEQIHLTSNFLFETETPGDGNAVKFLFIIGILVLLIAWFNYINLATARSELRAKEVGVRKVVGSGRQSLMRQFMTEAALINILAIIASFGLAQFLSPWFVALIDKPIPMSIFTNLSLIGVILGVFLLGTFLTGLYPAFLLSSFKPITVLKTGNSGNQIGGGTWLRKGLVVFQFIASVGLIASTMIVYNQLKYMQEKDLGLNIDQNLIIRGPKIVDSTFVDQSSVFQKEVEQLAAVKRFTRSTTVPGQEFGWTAGIQRWGAPEGEFEGVHALAADFHYTDAYEIEIIEGRAMSKDMGSDTSACLLNERAIEVFKFASPEDAIGEALNFWGDRLTIVGVVKNFHQESPKSIIEPAVIRHLGPNAVPNYFSVKLNTSELSQSISSIERQWNTFFPNNTFDYFFLDDHFNQQYNSDKLFGKVFTLFSGLAIFVSCLGLFALIAFVAERRKKEIGIRKVLGASVPGIIGMLSKDFLKLVVLALILATPLAWYFMDGWLDNFANRIDIHWQVFVVAGILAVGIAFLTVSFQSLKAALMNPVDSLRNE